MRANTTTYVIALMHVSLLLATAHRERRSAAYYKAKNSLVDNVEIHINGRLATAEDFEREADKISLTIFGRAASELL